ncbi:MAG: hypothetical protein WBO70_07240 [Erysipelotrichaceae bacterium]
MKGDYDSTKLESKVVCYEKIVMCFLLTLVLFNYSIVIPNAEHLNYEMNDSYETYVLGNEKMLYYNLSASENGLLFEIFKDGVKVSSYYRFKGMVYQKIDGEYIFKNVVYNNFNNNVMFRSSGWSAPVYIRGA